MGLTIRTLKELKVKQTLTYTLEIIKHVLEHPLNTKYACRNT